MITKPLVRSNFPDQRRWPFRHHLSQILTDQRQCLNALRVTPDASNRDCCTTVSLDSFSGQYYALYIELLEATDNATTLQGLLRRTKGAKETRDEMVWLQGRVLR